MWVTAFSHQYLLWGNVLVHCHVMSVFLETNIVRLIQMNLEKFGWLVYLQAFLGKEHNNKKLPHNYIIRKRNPAIHPTEKPVSLPVSSKSRDWSWNWHWYWIYWEMATMDVDRWRWLWTSSVSSCGLTNSDLGTSQYWSSIGPSKYPYGHELPSSNVCSRKWKDMSYPTPNQSHSILCWVLGKPMECESITKCRTMYLSPGCVSLSERIGNNIESIIAELAINIFITQWSIPRLRLIGCTHT